MERAEITVEVARALVQEQFPHWSHLPIGPVETDGNINANFRLGFELLIRLPTIDVVDVAKEHRWLPVLAHQLPLPIPEPVARGQASEVFPRRWSIYRWLEGKTVDDARPAGRVTMGRDLARFLGALQRIDPGGGPPPGSHSFGRGGPLRPNDAQTRRAIADLGSSIDAEAVTSVWEAALSTPFTGAPVWVHGDVAQGNLLVSNDRLSAVIDFGALAVGDPACDTVPAWTFLEGESRRVFRENLPVDDSTWIRGRGWALWWALVILAWYPEANLPFTRQCERVVADLTAEHGAEAATREP